MEITITRGLTELKTLDARIKKTINDGTYIGMATGKKPVIGYNTNEDFNTKVKANLQSVQDLIKRRNTIKAAIVESNAKTEVTVAGQKMTVAQAIERKTSIDYDKQLLQQLVSVYNSTLSKFNQENEKVQQRLDELLAKNFEKDVKATSEQYDVVAKPFMENNEPKLLDPLNLKEVIEKLDKEIADFEQEIDFILSESNSIVKIEVSDSI